MASRTLFLIGTVLIGATAGAYLALREATPNHIQRTTGESASPRVVPDGFALVHGRVLDPFDNPVSGCTVACAPELEAFALESADVASSTTRTDSGGRFEFLVAADPRPHVFVLEHPRFPVTIAASRPACRNGDDVPLRDVVLDSGSGITVTVRDDASGEPIAGARVTAQPEAMDAKLPAALAARRVRTATSDARGVAIVEGMQDGRYALRIDADGYATDLAHVAHAGVAVIPFRLETGHVLRGEVLGADGVPLASAAVRAVSARRGVEIATETRDGGSFRLTRLAAGRHTILVDTTAHGSVARTDVTLPSPVPIVIQMPPPVEVRGIVRPPPGAPASPRIELAGSAGSFVRTASCDGNGAFVIPGIPPGRYRLRATSEAPRLGRTIDLEVPCGTVDLALRPIHRIRGQLLDPAGRPLAGARISIMSAERSHDPIARFERRARRAFDASTDVSGRFDFEIEEPVDGIGLVADEGDASWSSTTCEIAPRAAAQRAIGLELTRVTGRSHETLAVRFDPNSSYLVPTDR
ncbi:MAG: carboxypeptidase regulatory-like domain-containing protein [Planctomycetes bacterium]|nr:carboxypeptidase regulatory-like domain-containing protein [Planctomycetota bacterium]